MPDASQPSLFDQFPDATPPVEHVLSPSEQFRRDNPDFVEPEVVRSEWDPNARRAEQLRGVGGGFASAVAGEIEVEPVPEATVDEESVTDEVADEDNDEEPATNDTDTESVDESVTNESAPVESEREKAMRLARELAERNATKEPLFPGAIPRDVADRQFYAKYWGEQARKQK